MQNHTWVPLLTGAALGAGTMFLLDPGRGTRRRALIRDKAVHFSHKAADAMDALGHDAANRTRGLMAETLGSMRSTRVSAPKLVERVRAELGRIVSHPRAIDVHASDDGTVRLSGPVLADEAGDAVSAIERVRGVCCVEDQLERHETAEGVPSLQGGRTRPSRRWAYSPRAWSPTTTALAALAGSALVAGMGYAALASDHTDWDYPA